MQRHGKQGQEVKNPAVWRKTGQPEPHKSSYGTNKFQKTDVSSIQGFGEAPNFDQRNDKINFIGKTSDGNLKSATRTK